MKKSSYHRIVPVEKLHFGMHSHGKYRASDRFVHSLGVLTGSDLASEIGISNKTINDLLDGIVHVLRCGYEVRLGDNENGVRFYPMIHTDYKTCYVAAATMGSFRYSIDDMQSDVSHNGEIIADSEMIGEKSSETFGRNEKERIMKEKRELVCVTPDTIVACPNCGSEFRVGKVLSSMK